MINKKNLKKEINNKTILITGGTGSFGKKCTEILLNHFKPKKIIIYSRDEFKQWQIKNQIDKKYLSILRFFIGDVRDLSRLNMAFKDVDIVIHAAALKQVPSAEYNPIEYINTNIMGAQNIILASISQNVKKIVALSTDKAANPINLYGSTKLASDKLFSATINLVGKSDTCFSVVRYGNVIGSRGSFIPKLLELKNNLKKTIPLTSDEMTRFWISLEDSVFFVLSSLCRMRGGEIFVPKIPSVKIIDLIKIIAPKNKIKVIGIRPGEKTHEILCPEDDSYRTLEFKDHFNIFPIFEDEILKYMKLYKINPIKEKGKIVKKNFSYTSGDKEYLMNFADAKKMMKKFYV